MSRTGRGWFPRSYLELPEKLRRGIWPWTYGTKSRLPLHYKKRYVSKFMKDPTPVHYRPDTRKWKQDKYGAVTPVQNMPIPIIYPKECQQGLWGGEGIIEGYRKKKNNPMKRKNPFIWKPKLTKRVLYSEILDKHMDITVTMRTLDLIDAAFGFDHYILETDEVDLQSELGMKLKRSMLMKLIKKDMYPNDPSKNDEIFERYNKYLIPEEEVSWLGLRLDLAVVKQKRIEADQKKIDTRPLKEQYLVELIDKIEADELEEVDETSETTSWMSKLNPFQKDSEKKPDS